MADSFRLRFTLPSYLKELYLSAFKNDLAIINGDPSWTSPMPARYVMRQDRTILYAEVCSDYTHRPNPAEIFPMIEEAASMAAQSDAS